MAAILSGAGGAALRVEALRVEALRVEALRVEAWAVWAGGSGDGDG